MCKDCFNLFKLAFNNQTTKMENSGGAYITTAEISLIGDGSYDLSKNVINNSSRFNPRENETQ